MSKADEIRSDNEKSARAVPMIVSQLRRATDSRELSQLIAAEFGLELGKAYTWVVVTEQQFDKSRRRIAGIGIAVLVVGFSFVAAGVIGAILETELVARPALFGLVVGVPVAAIGLLLGVFSRRIARVR